jgi:hypothetical protein
MWKMGDAMSDNDLRRLFSCSILTFNLGIFLDLKKKKKRLLCPGDNTDITVVNRKAIYF